MPAQVKNTMTPGLQKAFGEILKAAHRGNVRTGLGLQHDIVHVAPTAHVKTGDMRGSIVVVDHKGVVPASRQGHMLSSVPQVPKNQVLTIVTAPYAVYPHEMPADWLGPISRQAGDVGPKFVEKKLPLAAAQMGPIISESIKEVTK